MQNSYKVFIVIAFFFSVSCIEVAVGTAAVAATTTYVAKQGYLSKHVDRSFDSSWQIVESYAASLGKVTYNSKQSGVVQVDFEKGGNGTFRVEKVTNRASKVSIKCYKFAAPSNELAETYFGPLVEQL